MLTLNECKMRGLAAIDEAASPDWQRPVVGAEPAAVIAPAPLAIATAPPAPRVLTSAEILADHSKPLVLRCLLAWKADAALRAEFRSVVIFEAYQRAAEAGRVKIHRGGRVQHFTASDVRKA